MRILVADDNRDSRLLIADIVTGIGAEVIQAVDGLEAIEKTQAEIPDLVILDVTMPGMSGFEVCAHLKSAPETSHIPILMLTAMSDIDHRVQGLKAGADDYLGKPFSPRELVERVRARFRAKQETDDLRKTQQIIRRTFERYVAPAVVEQLLHDPTQVSLGGKLQEVTVLFADLENFTAISEHTPPEKLLAILNEYHTMTVTQIRAHGGTVDKFMGDGVMALYNAPLTQEDHALRAVLTALHIRDSLFEFHDSFDPPHRMRINFGLHTGMAVVGNVGAPDLMNFTAVGDTVNIAARLQAISRDGQILISAETHHALQERVLARPIGSLKMKGRTEAVMTYEVLGLIR